MPKQRVILLKNKPKGNPSLDNFQITERDLPSELRPGQVLIKTRYLSVDPYMRGKMAGTSSYTRPFKLNEPLYGDGLAEIVESHSSIFRNGNIVVGSEIPWADWSIVSDDTIQLKPDVDEEAALSCCGMTGETAYVGLEYVGEPKQGSTCVVSGASGAVGMVVTQILKLKGCKVVGIAGGKEKIDFAKSLGCDDTIDYKSEDLESSIKSKCPNGIDLYWDNIGGETLDTISRHMATFGRIVNCGAISQYNKDDIPQGQRNEIFIMDKRLRSQGFIIFDWKDKLGEAQEHLVRWYKQGKLKTRVTEERGLENVPGAFMDLFHGKNIGKMLVKL
jgi:NADPH-dependent curcumin reductase CurA